MAKKESAEKAARDIRRKTRWRLSAEEKIRIVIEGLRGEESIASLCRREGIAACRDRMRVVVQQSHDARVRPLDGRAVGQPQRNRDVPGVVERHWW